MRSFRAPTHWIANPRCAALHSGLSTFVPMGRFGNISTNLESLEEGSCFKNKYDSQPTRRRTHDSYDASWTEVPRSSDRV